MADPSCSSLGIPERLHSDSRDPDHEFSPTEHLYRRYHPPEVDISKHPYPLNLYSAALRFEGGMSVNRERYSTNPADVLFNVHAPRHHEDKAILRLDVAGLLKWSESERNDETKDLTLQIVHDPTQCMYPHAVVYVLKGDQRLNDVRPPSLKMRLRRELAAAGVAFDLGRRPLPLV